MARPIRNTPVLWGKDAVEFNAMASQKIPKEERMKERERVNESLKRFKRLFGSFPE